MGGGPLYLLYPRMALRFFWGRFGWGERYDCIMLDQKKDYLQEAVDMLPVEKIMVDSTFAFERLNTGRARGKVVVEIGRNDATRCLRAITYVAHIVFASVQQK